MDLKTLEKMTVIKLREEALKIPGISGVRGMTKEELVRAIAAAHGLSLEGRRSGGAGKSDLKKQIRELKAAISQALQSRDSVQLKKLRRHVKALKRQTRRLAAAASVPAVEPTQSTPPSA